MWRQSWNLQSPRAPVNFRKAESFRVQLLDGGREIAHARRVDQRAAGIERIRTRGGRGVTAFLLAHESAGFDLFLRQQRVHQRRLADAGLADEHADRAGEQRAQLGEAVPLGRRAGDVRVARGRVRVDLLRG